METFAFASNAIAPRRPQVLQRAASIADRYYLRIFQMLAAAIKRTIKI